MKAAQPADWKTKPLPSKKATIPLNRTFSAAEMRRIRMGLVPQEMEDKWFICWKDDALHFHRSWTGYCLFVVRFARDGRSHRMVEVDANRNPRQYKQTNDEWDANLISYLIDVLLLRRSAAFPDNGLSPDEGSLATWSLVGRAMLGEHPKKGRST